MTIRLAEWKICQSYCLIGVSVFLARTREYIKFFTLATVATLQHYLEIRALRVARR